MTDEKDGAGMETARRVYAAGAAARARAKRMGTAEPPVYMMNLGHPVVRMLYDAWKAGMGLRREDAPGDAERTAFELGMLNRAARREVERYLDRLDGLRGKAAQEGGADGADGV